MPFQIFIEFGSKNFHISNFLKSANYIKIVIKLIRGHCCFQLGNYDWKSFWFWLLCVKIHEQNFWELTKYEVFKFLNQGL